MRILIVILAAMAIGIGLGYTRMSTEFNGVEEKFTVFRQVLSTSNSQTASTDQTTSVGKSAEAEIPIANLLENPTFDFGTMEKGTTQSHSFLFENTGTGVLEIKLIKVTCKCTLSDLKDKTKRILPGQKSAVTLTYHSDNYAKRFQTSATLQTNDPNMQTIQLFVEGKVVQPVRPEPSVVVFNGVKTGEEAETRIRMYAYKTENPEKQAPLKIEGISFEKSNGSDKFFDVEFTEMDPDELKAEDDAQYGYVLTLKTKKGLPLGPINQRMTVATTRGEVEIPVKGKVAGDFTFSVVNLPGQLECVFFDDMNLLRFGTIEGNQDSVVELKLNTSSKENLENLEITIDENETYPSPKHIKAEFLKDRSKKFGRFYQLVVRITIPKDCPEASLIGPQEANYGKLVLRTNHPTAKTINILVNFSKIR